MSFAPRILTRGLNVAIATSMLIACGHPPITQVAAAGSDRTRDSEIRRQQRLEDLAYAREHYVLVSHAFSSSAREQALTLIRNLEQHADTLSNAEFLVGIARLTALAQNAHDNLNVGEGGWLPEKRLPFRLIWFPDALVIARAGPPVTDLAGARITAIEGLSPDMLFKRLAELCGGNENFCRWTTTWAIEYEGILQALNIAKSADKIQLSLLFPDGKRAERVVEMIPFKDVPAMRPPRLWSGELTQQEASLGWRAAIDPRNEPFYLRDANEPFRFTNVPSTDAAYLQFRINTDLGSHVIRTFAKETAGKLESHPVQDIVVDLRFDVGGDITRTRDLLRQLPNHVSRRIYLLVGRYTLSAGIVAAAIVKHYGPDRVHIVGEGIADRLHWWSEGREACLPNSHLCFQVTDGAWDLVKGCAGETDCYGDRIVPPVGNLDPEISAPLTATAWLTGQDPALDAILHELQNPLR